MGGWGDRSGKRRLLTLTLLDLLNFVLHIIYSDKKITKERIVSGKALVVRKPQTGLRYSPAVDLTANPKQKEHQLLSHPFPHLILITMNEPGRFYQAHFTD